MPTRGRKPKDVGRTFASLYETFISVKQAEGCRERTIKDYRDTLRDFSKFFDVNLVITNPKLYDALIFFLLSIRVYAPRKHLASRLMT